MKRTIFYAWQSDTPNRTNRGLIETALMRAIRELQKRCPPDIELELQQAARGVAGAPDIPATIFARIESATAFVADVTFINEGRKGRRTPNPNVLVETGYALSHLSPDRVVLVQNTEFHGNHELPFDIRNRAALKYRATDAEPVKDARAQLCAQLLGSLEAIFEQENVFGDPSYVLRIDAADERLEPTDHVYKVQATFTNHSDRRVADWELTLSMPAVPVAACGIVYSSRVENRSDPRNAFFRISNEQQQEPLVRVGDSKTLGVKFRLNEKILRDDPSVLDAPVTATLHVDGARVNATTVPLSSLQKFREVF